jgi:hypothetical protein
MGSIEKRTSRSTAHGAKLRDDAYVDHRRGTSRGFSPAGRVGRARCFAGVRAVGLFKNGLQQRDGIETDLGTAIGELRRLG